MRLYDTVYDISRTLPQARLCAFACSGVFRKPLIKLPLIIIEDGLKGLRHLWNPVIGFGDWLALDHDNPKERQLGGTELAFISSAFYYYSTHIVARAAELLNESCAEEYFERANAIKEAFLKEYFTPSGRLAVTTQTAYVISLKMGLYPDGMEKRAAKSLHDKLLAGQGYLKTGFLGTAYIMDVLSSAGFHRDACGLLLNEEAPGWLYAVNLGATTIWERWNSLRPDGTVNGTDMNSFNHYAYGAVIAWMYRHLAGIAPSDSESGFGSVICSPKPCRALKELKCSYQSFSGTYEIEWKHLPDHQFFLKIRVPFGAAATLVLPYQDSIMQIEAGEYEYTCVIKNRQQEQKPSEIPVRELKQIGELAPALDRCLPFWRGIPDMLGEASLRELVALPYLPVTEEALDELDRIGK